MPILSRATYRKERKQLRIMSLFYAVGAALVVLVFERSWSLFGSSRFLAPELNYALSWASCVALAGAVYSGMRVFSSRVVGVHFVYPDRIVTRSRAQGARVFILPKDTVFYGWGKVLFARVSPFKFVRARIQDRDRFAKRAAQAGIRLQGFPKLWALFWLGILAEGCMFLANNSVSDQAGFLYMAGIVSLNLAITAKPSERIPSSKPLVTLRDLKRLALPVLLAVLCSWSHYKSLEPWGAVDVRFYADRAHFFANHDRESLQKMVQVAHESQSAYHLNEAAWALAVVAPPELRDYGKAIEFSRLALKLQKRFAYADTLACAYMGHQQKDKALELARKLKFHNRVELFEKDGLCESTAQTRLPAAQGVGSGSSPSTSQ